MLTFCPQWRRASQPAPLGNKMIPPGHPARRLHGSTMNGQTQLPEGTELDRWSTSRGEGLGTLSERTPVLLVFLRHAGCTFCREALADLARQRVRIEKAGIHIVLVHMSSRERFRQFAGGYKLDDLDHITNPNRDLYRAFGLKRGSLRQLFGLEVWKRGVKAGIQDGHGIGATEGDAMQMPGAFLLHEGKVIRSHRHHLASDRPNYFLFCALPFLDKIERSSDVQTA